MKKEDKLKTVDNGRNHRRRSTLPEGKPAHFFKIILPTTILDKKLRIPATFVKDHGDDFSSIVTLSDPNAREWKLGLQRSEDDVWFCKGWDKFVEYYSISKENFLVFRYEGNSKFHVLIFDMGGSEIRYPDPNHNIEYEEDEVVSLESIKRNDDDYHWNDNANDDDDDYHFTEEDYTDHGDDSTDDNDDEDDDFAAYNSSSPSKSPSPFTPKRRGFTVFIDQRSKREREREIEKEKGYASSSKSAFRRKGKTTERSVSESDDQSDSWSEGAWNLGRSKGGDECCRCRRGKYGVRVEKEEHVAWVRRETLKSKSYKKRHISARESDKVMQAARKYRSEFPSFRAVLRPHNLYNSFVYVPARFALKYLDGRSQIIRLENSDGRQWGARCFSRKGSGCGMSIGRGWARFAVDNGLKEGDACVFELVKKKKNIVLKVKIFRVSEYSQS